MKILTLTILCSYFIYISCGIQTNKTKQRIEDSVKAIFLKSGMKQEDLHKLEVNDVEMICDKELIARATETKQFQVDNSIKNLQIDSLMIIQHAPDIANKSNDDNDKKYLDDLYRSQKMDNDHLSIIQKSLDSLLSVYQNADTTKMENYKATVHTIWRKMYARSYIYLDKNFNIIATSAILPN